MWPVFLFARWGTSNTDGWEDIRMESVWGGGIVYHILLEEYDL